MSEIKAPKFRCACPNCQQRFISPLAEFDAHVRTCKRIKSFEFPKYLMKVSDPRIGHENKRFVSMSEAGALFESGAFAVEIRSKVLEEEFSVRPVTEAEKDQISEIADKISASK